ncbi:MAG: ABC transporter permease [Gammaproteobacteria bacterium]|nr:ABC transporter permease [Gammaproteobacteria bacterium]
MNTSNSKQGDLFAAVAAHDLWSFLAWQDIKIRYRRSKIGPFWITISTAIFCVALGAVYSRLFKADIAELLPYLTIGMVLWVYISSTLGEMANLFVDNTAYIQNTRINPLSILLRAIARNTIIFGHNLLIVIGIYLYFGIWPGWNVLLVIPGFLLVVLNLLAISIPLSVIGARFRDLAQIVQSLLQVMFFITPIFWFPRLLGENSWIIKANPIGYFMDLVRSPLLGKLPELASWGASLLVLLISSIIAIWVYQNKRARIAFWV